MANRQTPFTRHEAVWLLDGYLETFCSNVSRRQVVKRVSSDLRQMGINNGVKIDKIYRNVSGIDFQMASMESAYVGKTIRKPASQLFIEIVNLYRKNRGEYDLLLEEARSMIDGHKCLNCHIPATQATDEFHALDMSSNTRIRTVDFRLVSRDKINCDQTIPISFSCFGKRFPVSSWKELFIKFCQTLCNNYSDVFGGMSIDDDGKISSTHEAENGLYLAANLNASEMIDRMRQLVEICEVDYKDIIIELRSDNEQEPVLPELPANSIAENRTGLELNNDMTFSIQLSINPDLYSDMPVSELPLPIRALNRLKTCKITTVSELLRTGCNL